MDIKKKKNHFLLLGFKKVFVFCRELSKVTGFLSYHSCSSVVFFVCVLSVFVSHYNHLIIHNENVIKIYFTQCRLNLKRYIWKCQQKKNLKTFI